MGKWSKKQYNKKIRQTRFEEDGSLLRKISKWELRIWWCKFSCKNLWNYVCFSSCYQFIVFVNFVCVFVSKKTKKKHTKNHIPPIKLMCWFFLNPSYHTICKQPNSLHPGTRWPEHNSAWARNMIKSQCTRNEISHLIVGYYCPRD